MSYQIFCLSLNTLLLFFLHYPDYLLFIIYMYCTRIIFLILILCIFLEQTKIYNQIIQNKLIHQQSFTNHILFSLPFLCLVYNICLSNASILLIAIFYLLIFISQNKYYEVI